MLSKEPETEAKPDVKGENTQDRIKATALRHALEIEAKKKLQSRVLDLAYQAFDLPSNPDTADPARPSPADLALFQDCLTLFRPEDLDDLVDERNIDNRCGWVFCPKENKKLLGEGSKAWNGKTGSQFGFVDKREKERWCSTRCEERNSCVRRQLKKEPAWLRETQNSGVKLLDDVRSSENDTKSDEGMKPGPKPEDSKSQMMALETERRDLGSRNANQDISIHEKEATSLPSPPQLIKNEMIEGLPTRNTDNQKR